MDLDAALTVFGLTREATPVDVGETYRKIRKPLLKELNKYDDADQPAELVGKLDEVDTAYKLLKSEIKPPPREATQRTGAGSTTKRTTGRVSFAEGDVLAGRYEIEALIAHRPEGDTYRVKDRVRGIALAMKVIAPQLLGEPRRRARLLRGLLAATRVNHPHVARVLDIHPLQQTYAVTQQIPAGAENLWDLMYGAEGKRDRLSPDVVLRMTEQATHALAELHRVTPHAALRPESIWLAEDGTVKLADFGFADVQRALRERRLSRTKLGTAYWAPEQYRDDVAVDGRSDQYSLALILYEILSGKPLVGRTQKIRGFRKDYPQRFTDAVERALSSKPARRFEDMNAFGAAAFSGYRAEGTPPVGSRESMLIPVLVLLAVFVGLALSPVGRSAAEVLGSAVRAWRHVDQQVADADLDLRRLRAMSDRLGEREGALDETSRAELAKVRAALDEPGLDADARGRINDDIAEIVRKLVADSYRRAETAMAGALKSLDRLERLGPDELKTTGADLAVMVRDFDPDAAPDDRLGAAIALVRAQAVRARAEGAWRTERARVRALSERAAAFRALLEAEATLGIGDEAATGSAYDIAAGALGAVRAAAEDAVRAVPAFRAETAKPLTKSVDGEDRENLLDALLERASDLADEDAVELARVLDGLRTDAVAAAEVRHLVHDDGHWLFAASIGARSYLAAGTWSGSGATRRMRVVVLGGRLLETPYEVSATRGADRPGLGDLRAALAAGPHDARAWWSVRRAGSKPPPAVSLTPAERTVRAGEVTVGGTLPAGAQACVLVDGRRSELRDGKFEARVRLSGDAVGTWVRAHAAAGLRSGPGSWMRLKTDVIKPRVQVLKPAAGAELDGGTDITLRIFVYDSNLETLEIGGKPRPLRPDDVYLLDDIPQRTPARGRLTVPLRAVDAAGNETVLELDWPIR